MTPVEFSRHCQAAVVRRADYVALWFDSKSGDFWSPKSHFRTERAAVVFHFETRDQLVTLETGPRTDGRPRSLLGALLPDRPMRSVLVDNILELRAPHHPRRLAEDSVEQQIQDQLDLLILFGPDVLRGNFDVFPKVEKVVKARARKHMEAWLGVERAGEWGWDAW